jgi:hypothetical protein
VSFTAGFLLPLTAMFLCSWELRIPVTVAVGLVGTPAHGHHQRRDLGLAEDPADHAQPRRWLDRDGAHQGIGHLFGLGAA